MATSCAQTVAGYSLALLTMVLSGTQLAQGHADYCSLDEVAVDAV
jgi:hypothetical protein